MERMLFRKLDIDDLIILSMLLKGCTKIKIAKRLSLTPPAISLRVRKYLFKDEGFFNEGLLTDRGKEFARKAESALRILEGLDSGECQQ